jgi:hypothetical protein
MRLQTASLLLLISAGVLTLQVRAQTASDPLSGIWTGDWGPTPKDRNNVMVELKWDGKNVTGFVKGSGNVAGPGTPVMSYEIPFKKGSFDAKTGKVYLEATAFYQGHPVRYVINAEIQSNLMTGDWKHGSKKGNLNLRRS